MSNFEILLRVAIAVLLYPGALFVVVVAVLAEGLRRNFAARAEGRQGPSLLQPVYDFLKWWRRSTLVPAPGFVDPNLSQSDRQMAAIRNVVARAVLFFGPALAIIGLIIAVVLLPLPGNPWPFLAQGQRPLDADLLAVVLLLELPMVVSVVLGSLGGSIYSQLAGSRVAQLAVVYAVPYAVAVFGPALLVGSLGLDNIAAANGQTAIAVKLVCGLLYLLCLPARLRLRPLAIAGGEGLEGVTTDLNGPPLGLYRLMEWLERTAAALLFAVLFVPFAGDNPLVTVGGVLFGLGAIGLIEVLFDQIRLRDALRFYLLYANTAALSWFLLLAFLIKI